MGIMTNQRFILIGQELSSLRSNYTRHEVGQHKQRFESLLSDDIDDDDDDDRDETGVINRLCRTAASRPPQSGSFLSTPSR